MRKRPGLGWGAERSTVLLAPHNSLRVHQPAQLSVPARPPHPLTLPPALSLPSPCSLPPLYIFLYLFIASKRTSFLLRSRL